MIRYTLACDAGHGFESWFPSSDSYDDQAARGLVSCPVCGSRRVGKGMMAPSIARTDRALAQPLTGEAASPPSASAAEPKLAASEPEQQLRALMRALREHATRDAHDVGAHFPEEARQMHYGERPTRTIYGEASLAEARALIDEGIAIAPLPPVSDDRH